MGLGGSALATVLLRLLSLLGRRAWDFLNSYVKQKQTADSSTCARNDWFVIRIFSGPLIDIRGSVGGLRAESYFRAEFYFRSSYFCRSTEMMSSAVTTPARRPLSSTTGSVSRLYLSNSSVIRSCDSSTCAWISVSDASDLSG